jgi:hypothetical protein
VYITWNMLASDGIFVLFICYRAGQGLRSCNEEQEWVLGGILFDDDDGRAGILRLDRKFW